MAFFKTTITHDYILKGEHKDFANIRTGVGEYVLRKLRENQATEKSILVDASTDEAATATDLLRDAVALAEALRRIGVLPGDIVGISSENRKEFVIAMLSTLFIGSTCAPLNPLYTIYELKHVLGISRPSIVFCSPVTASKLLDNRKEFDYIKKIIVFGEFASDKPFTPYKDLISTKVDADVFRATPVDFHNSVAVVLCSSGTTGLPKCVELTDHNISVFIDNYTEPRQDFMSEDIHYSILPFYHGYGFVMVLMVIIQNSRMVTAPRFQDKLYLEAIEKHKCNQLFTVPPILLFLAKHPLVEKYDLSSVKKIFCAGAPLSKEIQKTVEERLNITNVRQGYGMTEISLSCVTTAPNRSIPGSSGSMNPGMDCKVIDIETGKALPPHTPGEICFKGPFVMKGYKNNKKATDEVVDKDGWLHTGDIGYYDEEGNMFITDRLKELIKYKGFQVAPAEVEAVLLTHPAVKDAAVIGIPDEEAGELPFAFIVPESRVTPTVLEIQKFVAERLSPQKRLSGGVRFIQEIPKSASGKILRRELRILYNTIT